MQPSIRPYRPFFALSKATLTRFAALLACFLLHTDLLSAQTVTYSPPIVIKKGGTYTGNWESLDSNVAAVRVETLEPVVILNSNIRSAGHLINTLTGSNVTVRNCRGYGLLPSVHNLAHGRFVNARSPRNLVVENNSFENTSGIYVHGFTGNGSAGETVRIRRNKALNINGKHRDGVGFSRRQFVQLNAVTGAGNMEIAWNEVVNEPGKSAVEDNINIYNTSGVSASPLRIHNNFVRGGYAVDPMATTYTGGGIITDGSGTGVNACAFVSAYENVIINNGNYGMGIASGNNIRYYSNRIVSAGMFPDGKRFATRGSGVWQRNYYNQTSSDWHSNANSNNVIGWVNWGMNAPLADRHDVSRNACDNCPGNTALPNSITVAMEEKEHLDWLLRCKAAKITVGVNQAPVVLFTSPAANSAHVAGTAISLSAHASDSDGTVSRVEFFAGATKVGEATAAPFTLLWANAAVGSHSLTARATDNGGATATSAAVAVTVVANQAPVVSAGGNKSLTLPTSSLTLSGSASDPDGSVASRQWTKRSGPAAAMAGATTTSLALSGLVEGTYVFRLTATDNNGAAAFAEATVTVIPNMEPAVSFTSPTSGSSSKEGTAISLSAHASDSDGTVTRVEFFAGATKVGEATAAPFTFLWANAAVGSHSLTARATDNGGATATSAAVAVTVVANQAPVVSAGGNKSLTLPTSSLTLSGSASDPDGSVASRQWTKRSGPAAAMAGATTTSLALSGLVEGTYVFRLTATDDNGAAAFAEATVTVAPAPNAAPAVAISSPVAGASFVEGTAISLSANATDSDGTVSRVEFFAGATKLGEATAAPFTFSWANAPVGTHSLTARATDNKGATATSAAASVSVTWATGSLVREHWANVTGKAVSNIPVTAAPTSTSHVTSFEGPRNIGDNYGTRIRGYVHPPVTGDYTFWIAGDDHVELWLSTGESPADKARVAYHTSYSGFREWNRFSTQQSARIRLEAGKRYYIEALQKEATGGDHVSVSWQLPSGALEQPIPGDRLSPLALSATGVSASKALGKRTAIEADDLAEAALKVYPNPTKGLVKVKATAELGSQVALTITDGVGRTVYALQAVAHEREMEMELDLERLGLKDGLYFVQVKSGSFTRVSRLVKQR